MSQSAWGKFVTPLNKRSLTTYALYATRLWLSIVTLFYFRSDVCRSLFSLDSWIYAKCRNGIVAQTLQICHSLTHPPTHYFSSKQTNINIKSGVAGVREVLYFLGDGEVSSVTQESLAFTTPCTAAILPPLLF